MEFNLNSGLMTLEKNFKPISSEKIYDVMIIGGGPAGLTAAVYCMRKGITTALVAKAVGGQVAETAGIENYMGYRYINGVELVDKFKQQVLQFGIDFAEEISVTKIEYGVIKKIELDNGTVVQARTVIIATGKRSRKLNVPGEEAFRGKGVAYCSTCDAPLFAGKDVVVVGGGNSGVEAAIDLAKIAHTVTVVQFMPELTADNILIDKLHEYANVTMLYEHHVREILGGTTVETVLLKNNKNEKTVAIKADGIFIEIGLIPNSDVVKDLVQLNEYGEIIIDCSCQTSIEGVFAAGDVTTVPFKQIIVAGGEGAKAALMACDYVMKSSK